MDIRDFICELGRRMYERGYVTGTDGNISVRISENEILVTPSGVSKGRMSPDMLVTVSPDGNLLSGSRNPSSEIKMHLRAYEKRDDVRCVIHAHPPFSTAFAVCRIPLDKKLSPENIVCTGIIPVAPYARPSTDAVPDSIEPFLYDNTAVLLANHGLLVWDGDPESAYTKLEVVENYARISMYAAALGGGVELDEEEAEALRAMRGFYSAYGDVK